MREIKIAPSVMCCDFAHLEEDIRKLERGGARLLHFDIMDGDFVPNFTMGFEVLRALKGKTGIPFDAHLMIWRPERYVKEFAECGSDIISVHAEASLHLHRMVRMIKDHGVRAAVVLNPTTPLAILEYILDDLDMVLLMAVNPGFVGQEFIPAVLDKVGRLRGMIQDRGLGVEIEVDGNINERTIQQLITQGANIFVGGTSGVFKKGVDLEEAVRKLNRIAQDCLERHLQVADENIVRWWKG